MLAGQAISELLHDLAGAVALLLDCSQSDDGVHVQELCNFGLRVVRQVFDDPQIKLPPQNQNQIAALALAKQLRQCRHCMGPSHPISSFTISHLFSLDIFVLCTFSQYYIEVVAVPVEQRQVNFHAFYTSSGAAAEPRSADYTFYKLSDQAVARASFIR